MNNYKKKYAVLSSGYPHTDAPNFLGFVHSRVRAYLRMGIDVNVFCIGNYNEYVFEGVKVLYGDKEIIKNRLSIGNYDIIHVHFLDQNKIDILENRKCIIWVHGFEALSWKRRLYNINPKLPLYIYKNTKQLKTFRKYAKNHPDSKFIFVSKWMYNITCTDIKYKINNYEIIHNYIDSTIFKYEKKDIESRKKLLLIRSFANKKYANDITVKLIKQLSKKDYFRELDIAIYGKGRLFNSLMKKIRVFDNVKINNKFLTQTEIADIQKKYGIFLCPTRQDAQGVSMCEGMSSGLVPLTSYNTAIPEFVKKDTEGLLCDNNDISSFVKAYDKLYSNPDLFLKISKAASERVQKQCSYENTILREIEISNEM